MAATIEIKETIADPGNKGMYIDGAINIQPLCNLFKPVFFLSFCDY